MCGCSTLISNDEVAEFVAQSDGRLRGVAGADLTRPVQAVREARRAVQELGFVALRIVPWWWQLPPTDRLYYPLYAACAELGTPFCTQVGHTGPLSRSETGRPIPPTPPAATRASWWTTCAAGPEEGAVRHELPHDHPCPGAGNTSAASIWTRKPPSCSCPATHIGSSASDRGLSAAAARAARTAGRYRSRP